MFISIIVIIMFHIFAPKINGLFFNKIKYNNIKVIRMSSSLHSFATYNILSSNLCSDSYYTSCKPIHLDSNYRLSLIKAKLEKEIENNSIISLQEISLKWANELHPFFISKNYYLTTGMYGNKFNGYMGVGIAYPILKYELINMDITRIADTKDIKKKKFIQLNKFQKNIQKIKKLILNLNIFKIKKIDLWENILYRNNQMINIRLKEKSTGEELVIGTYHMPCMFKMPAVMIVHSALCAKHLQKFAKSDPYVLMGDFNIKPTSLEYELLTKGNIDKTNPNYPSPIDQEDVWTPEINPPLHSAYMTFQGNEPNFTNYAKVQEEPVFIDTLDYIFHSDHWKVDAVKALPTRDLVDGPLPNETEPSDHILISAQLSLKQ